METDEIENEPKFWQARIKVTQIPPISEEQLIFNPETHDSTNIDKSWLFDPFLDRTVYGLEIIINQYFEWVFFLYANSKNEALIKGNSYILSLEEHFPGLTGTVEALGVTPALLKQNSLIYELKLPPRPYNVHEKWTIINKIIQIFKKNEDNNIQFYIIWQRDDSINRMKLSENSIFEVYKLKIFIRIPKDNELGRPELLGQLNYLLMGIRNLKGERACIRRTALNTYENILNSNVFWVNKTDIHTNYYYHDISHDIPEEKFPSFISPARVDFSFIKELPLLKANRLPYENVNYGQNWAENKGISLGSIVSSGVPTNITKLLPVSHFAHSVFIAGQTGKGKTYYLGHICKEFYEKFKDIGVLILNFAKGRQEGFYESDEILKYGSSQFHLDYFYEGDYFDRSLQETASYLVASLGLSNPCDKILYSVMKAFLKVDATLPKSLKTLFEGLRKWFIKYPYHKKFQTGILRALQNRVINQVSDPLMDKTLQLTSSSLLPSWFQKWRDGKTIYIDLCMCNIWDKRLITSAIFQMVKVLTPDIEAGRLQNIIVIDEAYRILGKPDATNPKTDEFISKEQLEIIFSNLIREFRSKGLSFFLVDNHPQNLFSSATALPNLKILFGLDHLDLNIFTRNPKIQDYLVLQQNRNALIMNGNNEEFFVVKTPNYNYSIT
ncbi:MAG: hypothetical protein ACFFE4_04400 [Candidatus Thorarchaeota archaeon]